MLKLLIAVKSETLAKLLSTALVEHEVHICDTGLAALALIDTLRPEILILDLTLPEMDGITILQKASFKPRIILAITNLATVTVLEAASDAGIQEVILIPCTIRHVLKRLDLLIKKGPSPEA